MRYFAWIYLIIIWSLVGVFVTYIVDNKNNSLGVFLTRMKAFVGKSKQRAAGKLCHQHLVEYKKKNRPKLFFVVESRHCDKCKGK